ncbi:hypothetical protein SLA2020_460020 [Shorea laevis]
MDAHGVCSTQNPELILKYMGLKDIRLGDGKLNDIGSCNCNLQNPPHGEPSDQDSRMPGQQPHCLSPSNPLGKSHAHLCRVLKPTQNRGSGNGPRTRLGRNCKDLKEGKLGSIELDATQLTT